MEIGKKTWVTMLPFAKNWLAESWRVDRGGSSQAFPPGSKPADTGISHDFTRRWSTTMRQASISRFWIAQEGHVFCAGSNHKRETEVNKQRTSVLKGRNQFSSEVWRMVGLINCGYAEVGSSFQDILDTRSYVLCTKSKHFQTPPKAQRNIYI